MIRFLSAAAAPAPPAVGRPHIDGAPSLPLSSHPTAGCGPLSVFRDERARIDLLPTSAGQPRDAPRPQLSHVAVRIGLMACAASSGNHTSMS